MAAPKYIRGFKSADYAKIYPTPNFVGSQPSAIDKGSLTQYLLANAAISPMAIQGNKHKRQGPTFIERVIDILSRPNYAIAETAGRELAGEDPLSIFKGTIGGLAGKNKTTFQKVLAQQGVKNPVLRYGGGLALDILTDPTTYIGASAIKGALSGKKVEEALTAAERFKRPPGEFVEEARLQQATQKLPEVYDPNLLRKPPTTAPIIPHQTASQIARDMPEPAAVERVLPKPKPVPQTETELKLADEVATKYMPRFRISPKAREALGPNVKASLNPSNQANLYNALLNATIKHMQEVRKIKNPLSPRFAAHRQAMTVRMLTATEDRFLKNGRNLIGWDGNNIRLSDVIAELPERDATEIVAEFTKKPGAAVDPEVAQAIENIRARSAMSDSVRLTDIIKRSMHEKTMTDAVPLSEARKIALSKQIISLGRQAAKDQKVSPVGQRSYGDLMKDMFYGPVDSPVAVAEKYIGRDIPEAKEALTKALAKNLDSHESLKTESVTDWVMARMTTWWGQKDLRPLVLNSLGSGLAAAERRWRALFAVANKHTPEEIRTGWQGATGSATTSELALQMRKAMEDMTSAIARSGINIDTMNKHLRRARSKYIMTKKEMVTKSGKKFDFTSKGEDWRNSWKAWDPVDDGVDPLEMIHRYTLAAENATREKAVIDEIATRFGGRIPVRGARTTINSPYLEGFYFDDELAPQIQKVIRSFDSFYDPKSEFMKLVDRSVSAWKAGVTIYNPIHHTRNIIGDTFLAWLDGVNNPRVYSMAARVLRAHKDRYIDMSALPENMFRAPTSEVGGKVITRNRSGVEFTDRQLYAAAFDRGIFLPSRNIEDIYAEGELIPKNLRPLRGHGKRFFSSVSETREHYVRMAHFIDRVNKSKGKDLERIFEEAANRVRKWHPDGLDLTVEERRVLRRLAPFYSWTRKAIPLLVEGALEKPGKTILAAPRTSYTLQGMLGGEPNAPSDQFPVDQLFPSWIREKGIGPLGPLMGGSAGNYTVINPSNPFMDMVAQFSNPLSGVAQMMNPAIRIPAEEAFGRELFSGAPITDQSDYLMKQVPIASRVQAVTTGDEGGFDKESFINWLTGVGYRETGKYQPAAFFEELRKRQR